MRGKQVGTHSVPKDMYQQWCMGTFCASLSSIYLQFVGYKDVSPIRDGCALCQTGVASVKQPLPDVLYRLRRCCTCVYVLRCTRHILCNIPKRPQSLPRPDGSMREGRQLENSAHQHADMCTCKNTCPCTSMQDVHCPVV